MRAFPLIAALCVAACAADPPSAAMPAAAAAPIVGTRWIGTADAGEPGHTPTLEFVSADHVAGFTGCNMLSGHWQAEAGALRLSHVVITKRACAGAENDIERRVLAAINDNSKLAREDGKLVATGASGARYEFSAAK